MNAEDYLNHLKNEEVIRPSSIETYSFMLLPFERWMQSKQGKDISECQETEIRSYLKTVDWSEGHKNYFLIILKGYIKWYRAHTPRPKSEDEKWDTMQRTEQILIMRPYRVKTEKPKRKDLSLKMLEKLLKLAREEDTWNYNLMYLSAYFGWRKGEMFSLREKDINRRRHLLEIRAEKSKTYQARTLYYNKYVSKLLDKTDIGELGSPKTFEVVCRRYGKKLNTHFHPHMLRHTFATQMIECLKGEAKAEIIRMTLMGHKIKAVALMYPHPSEAELRKAMTDLHYMKEWEF